MGKKVKVAVGSKSVPSLPFIYLILFFLFLAHGGKVMVAKLTPPIWPPSPLAGAVPLPVLQQS